MKKIIAMIIMMSLLLLSGCDMPSISLTGYESTPEQDFSSFISYLNTGEYDLASEYIDNYSSLGFDSFQDNEVYTSLLDALNSSRSFKVMGSSSINGRHAKMSVEFTTLDFRIFSNTLSDTAIARIDQTQYDNGIQLTDDEIKAVIIEVLASLMEDPTQYYTTQIFDLEFKYVNDTWKLSCSKEFYSALIGYIV